MICKKEKVLYRPNQAASGLLIALMMETASASETSVNFYQTTRRRRQSPSYSLP
jgi:hypothetical protein